jgi:hypothetical protein
MEISIFYINCFLIAKINEKTRKKHQKRRFFIIFFIIYFPSTCFKYLSTHIYMFGFLVGFIYAWVKQVIKDF